MINEELNLTGHDRVGFCERQINWWIQAYPHLYKSPEYRQFWHAMKIYVRYTMLGTLTMEDIERIGLAAEEFMSMVHSNDLSPFPAHHAHFEADGGGVKEKVE